MSEIVNTATIKVVADTEQVEAGLRKVEVAAQSTGKNIESLGRNDRGFKNLSDQIQQTTLRIEAGKRGTAEWFATMANAKGINPERLKSLLDALDSAKRKAEQAAEAQRKLDESTKFLDGLRSRADAIGKTASELLELRAAELGVADAARPMIQRLREAEEAAERGTSKFGKFGEVVDKAKGILLALGAGAALGAFAAAVKSSVDNLAELDDMAQKTGSSIESLSKLQKVATVFAADMGQIDSALVKLAKGMVSVDEEGSKTQKALGALGLSARDAAGNLRDPSELMAEVAKRLQDYRDGAGKAALANDLFGKSGADLLPYLNDLAENYDRVAGTSAQAAAAASALQDQMGWAKLRFTELATTVATATLPALSDLAGAFGDVIREQNTLNGGAGAEWADDLAVGLARVMDVAVLVPRTLSAISSSFKVVAADLAVLEAVQENSNPIKAAIKIAKGGNPIEDIKKAIAERNKTLDEANRKYDELWNKPANQFEQAMLARINARGQAVKAAVDTATKDLDYSGTVPKVEAATRSLTGAVKEHSTALDANTQRYNEAIAAAEDELRSIGEQVEAQQKANDQIGLSKSELAELAARRLDDAAALKEQTAAALEAEAPGARIAQIYREQAAELRNLAQAKREGGLKQAGADAAEAAKREFEKMEEYGRRSAEQIGQSLTDNLMRGGKSAAEYLKDLFRTLILRPILSPIRNAVGGFATSAFGLPGSASASTGGEAGGSGVAQNVANVFNALKSGGTLEKSIAESVQKGFDQLGLSPGGGAPGQAAQFAGKLGSTAAGYMLGSSINKGISNGFETGDGFMTAQKIGTAVASWFGGPLGGMIAGTIGGLINRAFGRGPKEILSTTLNGSFDVGGFSGSVDQAWKREGGWFRSDKRGIDKAAVDAAMAKELTSAYDVLKVASADFASVLGINAESLKTRTQSLSIALGKDEEANKKAIADFFIGVGDTIAKELLPSIGQFAKEGEGAAATLERVATSYALIDTALESISKVFGQVGVDSIAARERLIELSGGLDAFAQNTAGFQQNFLTEAERNAPVLKRVTAELAAMGLSAVDTREEFKAVVLGLDLTTEAGAKQYGALMKLQAAFAQVYPAIDRAAIAAEQRKGLQDEFDQLTMTSAQLLARQRDALDESNRALFDSIQAIKAQAAAAQAVKDQASTLLGNVDSAFSVLQRMVGRERELIQSRVTNLRSLSDALRNTFDSIRSPEQVAADRESAKAEISAALAIAKAGGPLPDAEKLRKALADISKGAGPEMFATFQDYQRELLGTQGDLKALADITDSQLSVEEKALAKYDAMLEKYQEQIDVLKGISTTGLSIQQAIEALKGALLQAQGNPVVSATSAINDAYKSALGRPADSKSLEFWQDKAAQGVSQSDIIGAIKGSPEAQIQKLYKELFGRSADAGGLQFWLSQMGKGVSLADVRAALEQSDEAKKKLRGFAVGTNRIPYDMPAFVHQDERIIPAADNRELMRRLASPSENNAALAAAVDRLTREVEGLRAETRATATHTEKTARYLGRVVREDAIVTTTES